MIMYMFCSKLIVLVTEFYGSGDRLTVEIREFQLFCWLPEPELTSGFVPRPGPAKYLKESL